MIGNRISGGTVANIWACHGGPYHFRENVSIGGKSGLWIGEGVKDVLVISNTFRGTTSGSGIWTRPQGTNKNQLFINNLIYNCKGDGILVTDLSRGRGLRVTYGSDVTIINNVIYNNGGDGVRIMSKYWKRVEITSNIITGNKGYGIHRVKKGKYGECKPEELVKSYNNVWANASGNYGNTSPGKSAISVDPLFADPAKGDFHLKSKSGRWDPKAKKWVKDDVDSLCIDAGDPKADFSKEPVPNGGRVNVGAYGNTGEASKSSDH